MQRIPQISHSFFFSAVATYVPSGIRLVQSRGRRLPPLHPSTTTTTTRITTPTPQTTTASPPPLSPCSSAGSTKSSSADYIWDGSGLYVLDDDQHRHFSSSNPGERDPQYLFHNWNPPSTYDPLRTSPNNHRLPLTACDTRHDMKKMMGFFHLDPFIFKGGSWQQEENTGLKEKLVCFQLRLGFSLGDFFEQCKWSPQPEEPVDRTYREEPGTRGPSCVVRTPPLYLPHTPFHH